MTVVTKGASRDDIPFFLLPYECYIWPSDKKKMENIIEGRPEFRPPPISAVRNEPKPRMVTAPVFCKCLESNLDFTFYSLCFIIYVVCV